MSTSSTFPRFVFLLIQVEKSDIKTFYTQSPKCIAGLVAYGIAWGYLPVTFLQVVAQLPTPLLHAKIIPEFLRVLGESKTDLKEKEMLDILGKFFKQENRNEAFLNAFVTQNNLGYLFPSMRARNEIETKLKDGTDPVDIVGWIEVRFVFLSCLFLHATELCFCRKIQVTCVSIQILLDG
jgi:hypothetical protein